MLSDTGKPSDLINFMGNNTEFKAYGVLYEGFSYLSKIQWEMIAISAILTESFGPPRGQNLITSSVGRVG